MAKGYTFTDVPQPTSCSATAVAGGSLAASTTYYYRIYKVATAAAGNSWLGKSLPSAEFSVTTDATDKTARITFTCADTSGSYRIFRHTTSGFIEDNYVASLAFYPTDALYNTSGTVTFDDTGYAVGGNNFLETKDNAHGVLELSGSTSSDKFSIVDLYNADVAGGWGVIERISTNVFKVNCYVIGHANMYWYDVEKTIIFADGVSFSTSANIQFGDISGTNLTSRGCNLIFTPTWLSSTNFGTCYMYRTHLTYLYPRRAAGTEIITGLGLIGLSFYGGILQDCTIDRPRNFIPLGGSSCTFKNVIVSRFDNAFSSYAAVYDGIRMLSGSRVWQLGGTNTVTGRDVYTESTNLVLLINATGSLTIINSISDLSIIQAGTDNTGFTIYDQFSYNLTVVDDDGVGIETANVKVYDKDDTEIIDVNSGTGGVVAEQFITRRESNTVVKTATITTKSPFTLVVSKAGYETYEEIFTPALSEDITKLIKLKPVVKVRKTIEGEFLRAIKPEDGSSAKLLKL